MAKVADIIKQLRQDRNMTQLGLAARSGLKYSLIRSIESGRNQLTSCATRVALAKAFGVSTRDLIGADDAPRDQGNASRWKRANATLPLANACGDIIKQLRQDRNMTQEDLAARAGLKFSLIRSIESGRNQLTSYATRVALAKAFGVQLVELSLLLDAPSPTVDVITT
jgi:transcriptional regulator with XRE-family HTH domain